MVDTAHVLGYVWLSQVFESGTAPSTLLIHEVVDSVAEFDDELLDTHVALVNTLQQTILNILEQVCTDKGRLGDILHLNEDVCKDIGTRAQIFHPRRQLQPAHLPMLCALPVVLSLLMQCEQTCRISIQVIGMLASLPTTFVPMAYGPFLTQAYSNWEHPHKVALHPDNFFIWTHFSPVFQLLQLCVQVSDTR
uniref:Uncharacterized protein n=1 Tax=Lygus hesperus TaxID=30085 RepID=A0A146L3C9_LYGHE